MEGVEAISEQGDGEGNGDIEAEFPLEDNDAVEAEKDGEGDGRRGIRNCGLMCSDILESRIN